jgi:PAS domain S-box-containing protein
LVAFDFVILSDGTLKRRPGPLFPAFACYFVLIVISIICITVSKWRAARGIARAQLRYYVFGVVILATGATTMNLLVPAITHRSTYSTIGPSFALAFVALIAHAIIRHRLMDLRLVIRRSLTLTIAILVSLAPVGAVLAFFWPRLSDRLAPDELVGLLLGIIIVSLLIPPIQDVTGRLLDTYVYRTRANYQRTVREASRALTRVLDLKTVLSFVVRPVADSMQAEGTGVYLQDEGGFALAIGESHHEKTTFTLRQQAPDILGARLRTLREPLVTDELGREAITEDQRQLHEALMACNWALVLPLLSEDAALGAIVVGPKLSGDPFYPHDLDLLMTLANQAGIAIKNAQLFTQVVLANEYVRNIVATIQSGVVAVDSAGRVTMFNPTAEKLTSLSAGEALAGPAAEILPDGLAVSLTRTLGDGVARTEPEITLPGRRGSHPVICTTSPLRDAAGTVVGAVAVFSDLTPLKQLENERRRAERLAYFEMFAPSIAHEIKNPLVAIKAFAQLIPRRHHEPRFIDDFSRVVTREIGRIERLLERLRTLSRATDRPPQRLDIRAPILEAVEFLQATFDEKRVGLTLDLGPAPRFIIGDHGEMEQLFLNLLMNGHEATPPEGSVSVALTATDVCVTVTVADTGPGIPPALLEQVFDPFFTTRQRGSGLGLTICAAIAAAHRAKLHAANRPGGGAIFSLEFPCAAAVEAPLRV